MSFSIMSLSDYGNINLSSLVSLHTFLNKEQCYLDVLTLSFVLLIKNHNKLQLNCIHGKRLGLRIVIRELCVLCSTNIFSYIAA